MHIGAIIALAAVLVFVVIVGLLSYLVFVKFLRRDAGRQRAEAADFFVRAAAGSLGERWQGWHEHFERERGWFFGLGGYCDMRIESGGHKLAGHVVDQNAEITVIILHGYG
ncbi:MAG: hypothetical protein FWB71_03625, partial [Defluviitaleaceae bacterium]|nr:hypothetical protein [Defluviitaleaceae bacterium]